MNFEPRGDAIQQKVRNNKDGESTYGNPTIANEAMYSKILSFSTSDHATKRVIAPYVRIMRKGQKDPKTPEQREEPEFSFFLQRKPSVLQRNLSAFLSDTVDLPDLMHESADVLKRTTKANDVSLYIVDSSSNELYISPRYVLNGQHKVNWKITAGTTVAAYVAYTKEYIMSEEVLGDIRFPYGIDYKDSYTKSVLCVPVVTPENDCLAILELTKDVTQPPFDEDDVKITVLVSAWIGAAIHQNQQRVMLQKQQELNDYLLDLVKCYFSNAVGIQKLINEIANFAKTTLSAERGTFYLLSKNNGQLLADVYDEGIEETSPPSYYKRNLKLMVMKEHGFASYVASTGKTINIKDARLDSRFGKYVDERTGFIFRSVLCMPVEGLDGILGVLQVVNKKSGANFTNSDENLLKTFSTYFALALHYCRLQTIATRTENLSKSYYDLIRFHMQPCPHDLLLYKGDSSIEIPPDFITFQWYCPEELLPMMPQFAIYLINTISGIGYFVQDNLIKFVLTIRKSYHDNPYHNFEHGFHVCHSMFNIVYRNVDIFDAIEQKALVIAALCHDVDHPGFTNNFLQVTNHVLANLYEESVLENHHYMVAMMIIKNTGLFDIMSEETYKSFAAEIKSVILATDLASYFRNRVALIQLWHDNTFNYANNSHRGLLKAIVMTSTDLCGSSKPFNKAKMITDNLYREFYHQGDVEKERGYCPLSMMDRDKKNMIPQDQVQFLQIVVIPCLALLSTILPTTEDMLTLCMELRDTWKEIISFESQECWNQEDSVVKDQ